MVRGGGGSIVNVASIVALLAMAGQAVYAMTKAGLISLTRSFAKEYGQRGVRVNAILPGAIVTERQLALWATPEEEQIYLEQQCLKFRISVDDVARTALFLASDEARAVTGQCLIVDAGLAQTSAT